MDRTRRRLLQLIAAATALAWGLWRFLAPPPAPGTLLATCKVADLPADGALVFREQRIAVIQRGAETFAVSLACTHLGCTVNVTADGFTCPCHGSTFDPEGKVLTGPAGRPLDRLLVQRKADHLEVRG